MPWVGHAPYTLALPLIRAVCGSEGGEVGGCLHIVLDDNNTSAEDIRWCRSYTEHWHGRERGQRGGICATCDECAKILLLLSTTARKKAIATFELESIRAMHAERESTP